MTVVLGVDLAFTCTGVGVRRDDGVLTFSVRTPADVARVFREMRIVDMVMPWVDLTQPMLCMVEAVYQGRFGRTSLDLSGLHDVLVYEFVRRGIRVGVVSPKTLKSFATGGGAASKKEMLAAAQASLGVKCANHNEADGLWLATMGVVAMGGTINGWPTEADENRAHALDQVTWIGGPPGLLLRGT